MIDRTRPNILRNHTSVALSEKLREELEQRIDSLFARPEIIDQFLINCHKKDNANENDFLKYCIIGEVNDNGPAANRITTAVKTWFNMYHDDRLSVLYKFTALYKITVNKLRNAQPDAMHIVFCRFFITELTTILTDTQWKPLIR